MNTPTLIHRLHEAAAEFGDRVAYTELDGRGAVVGELTYAELLESAESKAAGLVERGLQGERVVLELPNGLDFVTCFLGCLSVGAVPVAVESLRRTRGKQHFQAVVADCRPRLVVSAGEPHKGEFDWCAPEALESGERWKGKPEADSLAYLQYTSGSTSRPRGVMVTHQNILSNNDVIKRLCEQPWGCTLVSWLPVYHDMGLVSKVLQALYLGGRCVLLKPSSFLWKPSLWLQAISDFHAHTSGAPNFAFELAVEKIPEESLRTLDLSSWKTAFCAAEPVRAETMERFRTRFAPVGFEAGALKPAYGLAEFTLCATLAKDVVKTELTLSREALQAGRVEPAATGVRLVNCGVPASGTTLTIVAPETELELEEDQIGEIVLQGPSRSPGYWQESPAEKALRTGDLGFLHAGGLFIVGRSKDLIIVDGRNVHPEDIERSIETAQLGVKPGACAAYALKSERGEVPVVAVELRKGDQRALERDLVEHVSEVHGVPLGGVLFLKPGELPRTSSGKVRRGVCGQTLPTPRGLNVEQSYSSNEELHPVEAFLVRRLSNLSRGLPVEPTTAFEALGIASVDRFNLMGSLAQALGVPVAGDATWTYRNPRELAKALDEKTTGDLQVFQLGRSHPVILVPAVSGGFGWSRTLVSCLPDHITVVGARQDSQTHPHLEGLAADLLEKITARYPDGPYTLVGYSKFCRLGYEMARQLKARGLEVEALFALDGSALDWERMPWSEYLYQIFNRLLGQAMQVGWERGLAGMRQGFLGAVETLRRFVHGRFQTTPDEAGRSNGEEGDSSSLSFTNYNLALLGEYRAAPTELRMTVFRVPSNSFSPLHMRGAGWRHLVGLESIEIVDLEGTHVSLLKRPTMEDIAGLISSRVGVD